MGILRKYKVFFAMYNFFHRNQLAHNIPVLKKYGIKKSYFDSISSKDFKHLGMEEIGWNEEGVKNSKLFQTLDKATQQNILDFDKNGYLIIPGYLNSEEVDSLNNEIDSLLKEGTVKAGHRNKIMFAIKYADKLRGVAKDADLIELLGHLFGDEAILFSSINFAAGSEQASHSDSIHMTTYPLGGLLGAWIALEDINDNNGPLHYYPGSHKLPYYLNSDYDNEGTNTKIGPKDYNEYEGMMARKIEEQGLEKKIFLAKKGDLLVWHANLFHGGEAQKDRTLTRKSVVFHYFRKNSVCYHEISQRPALLRSN